MGELRNAIAIETKRLEETRNIKLADDTLQTLIADYEIKQKELEKRHAGMEVSLNEEMEQKRKTWEREQEEYKYTLKIERKKEEDAYGLEQGKKKSQWQEEINKKEFEKSECGTCFFEEISIRSKPESAKFSDNNRGECVRKADAAK